LCFISFCFYSHVLGKLQKMFLVLDDSTATAIQQRRQDGWNNNSGGQGRAGGGRSGQHVSSIVDKFSRGTKRQGDGRSGSPAKNPRR